MVKLDDSLSMCYNGFLHQANKIPNWVNMTKTQLANGYCDADESGNIIVRDRYFSALTCKYFYLVPLIYEKSKTLLIEIEDTVSWLTEGILKALNIKIWRNPDSKYYNNAEPIINRCIDSIRYMNFKNANLHHTKLNYNCLYLDDYCNVEDPNTPDENEVCDSIVKQYIKSSKILSGVVVDLLCYDDTFSGNSFNNLKLVRRVNESFNNKTYYTYFADKYGIEPVKVEQAFNDVAKNFCLRIVKKKLTGVVNDTLNDLRNNPDIRSLLC